MESRQEIGQGDRMESPSQRSALASSATEKPINVGNTPEPHKKHHSSSESDSDRESHENVLYENLPEFQDLTPIALVDSSVMPIAYNEKFKSVFGYFRALVAAGELSRRALRVCEDAVKLNAANYAVWMFRRKILEHLNADYRIELEYTTKIALKNPKNYQIWFHRQRVVELLHDPSQELSFTARILVDDAKNYHAWQYRQFVLRKFHLPASDELKYTAELITKDPFNNSAWMQRYFVLDDLPKADGEASTFDGAGLQDEIKFTLVEISKAVHNESPWSYLRGMLCGRWSDNYAQICSFCEDLYRQGFRSAFLLAFMVDMFDEDLENGYQSSTDDQKKALLTRTVDICRDLAEEQDRIRRTYWKYIGDRLQVKYAAYAT